MPLAMQHYRSLYEVSLNGAWLTIGSFDGVHRGHQEIIRQLTAGAHEQHAPAVVLTFFPHPAMVLRGQTGPFYLTTPDERAALLGSLGVDVVITQAFDRNFSNTSARDFLVMLKDRLDVRHLCVGPDFALGRGREGDVTLLTKLGPELGYTLKVFSPVEISGQVISSTRIRSLLTEGNVSMVEQLLGRPYRVTGEIIRGDGRGRTIGIPTANLAVWQEQLLPAVGVYACRAWVDGRPWAAAANLGVRPTFEGTATLSVEAHLLDFDGDLYGRRLSLDFETRLRGEQKFPSVQALISQIQADIVQARSLIAL
jgi:riboflavin kinase / FMN adenylyltransferase